MPDAFSTTDAPAPLPPEACRKRMRGGFALCATALSLAAINSFVPLVLQIVMPPTDADALARLTDTSQWLEMTAQVIIELALAGGFVCFYLARRAGAWRRVCYWSLAMVGADFVAIGLVHVGNDRSAATVAWNLAAMLGWVELWMIAVLAAEAAEMLDRYDVVHQTEVAGRLILCGGFAWLGMLIWSFEVDAAGAKRPDPSPGELSVFDLLGLTVALVNLFVLFRAAIFCGRLAVECGAADTDPEPKPLA
jgi:hypothetical protein